MKRIPFVILGIVLVSTFVFAEPVLFEAFQTGEILVEADASAEAHELTSLVFSVDSDCYMLITAGGLASNGWAWLDLDGDSLSAPARYETGHGNGSFNLSYVIPITAGEHTMKWSLTLTPTTLNGASCRYGFLQALVFLPDSGNAVAEQPNYELDEIGAVSVISSGPYVDVSGCTQVVDAAGRVIENVIQDNKVYVESLPKGTYFAKRDDVTAVKIVKVH